MKNNTFIYSDAKHELQELLDWFESGSPDLDKALEKYKRAEELLKQIEAYLNDMEKKLSVTVHASDKS